MPSPNNPGGVSNSVNNSPNWSDIVDFGQESTNDPQSSTAAPGHDRYAPRQEQNVPVTEPAANAPKKAKKRMFSETNNPGDIRDSLGSSPSGSYRFKVDSGQGWMNDPQLAAAASGHYRDSPGQEQHVPVTEPAARAPKKAKRGIFSETDAQTERHGDSTKHKLKIDKDVNVYNVRQHVDTTLKVERLRARKKEERLQKTSTDAKEHAEYKNTEDEATEDELESEEELKGKKRQEELSEWELLGMRPQWLERLQKPNELEAIEDWHKRRIKSDRIARGERRKKREEDEKKAKEAGEDKDEEKKEKKKEPRTIEACNYCKCKPCRDAKTDCFFAHPAVGEPWKREWPVHRYGEVEAERDYYREKVKHLEQLVDLLKPKAVLGLEDRYQIDEWETQQEAADTERKRVVDELRTSRWKYKQEYLERKKEKLAKPEQKGSVIEEAGKAGTRQIQLSKQQQQRQPPSSTARSVINDPTETQVGHVSSYTENPYSDNAAPARLSEQEWVPLPTDSSDDELDPALTNPVRRRRPQQQQPRARPSGQLAGQPRPTMQSTDSQVTRDTGNPYVPSSLEPQQPPQRQPPYERGEGAQPEQSLRIPSPPFDFPSDSPFL
ncbi:hypothetical protein ACJ73_00992 [Blastomyces percursus]|uniref:Uncharacterized protein n=1 Tax=Blastomyces percursus TaxID=1658174 RepID=A0A1J9RJ27_9EURO|nr:hypothetical protein ACJ73_00992 [Blastomyces percursus]